MPTEAALISQVLSQLRCPVEWDFSERSEELSDGLGMFFWHEVAASYQVDLEAGWILQPSLIEDESIEDLTADLANIATWIERARVEYVSRTRRFWALTVAGPEEYSKHYPSPGESLEAIRSRTDRTQVSSLFPGIRAPDLHEALWEGMSHLAPISYRLIGLLSHDLRHLWERVLYEPSIRLAFDTMNPIGACNGFDSDWLCYEIDASTPIAHAYPVSEAEAREIMTMAELPWIDSLQTSGRPQPAAAGRCRPWGTVRSSRE